jgi:hypothetical protein
MRDLPDRGGHEVSADALDLFDAEKAAAAEVVLVVVFAYLITADPRLLPDRLGVEVRRAEIVHDGRGLAATNDAAASHAHAARRPFSAAIEL